MSKKLKKLTTLILVLTVILVTVMTVTADTVAQVTDSELTEIEDDPTPLGALNNTSQLTGMILLLVIGGIMIIATGAGIVFYRNLKKH